MKQNDEFFARLVKEHKSTIYTVCYMFSHDEEEVNDLFQETLINMWKGIDSFREESKISTWIYRVALNTCLLQERKKKKEAKKVPLTMNVNFFEDSDANSVQVRQLHQRIGRLGLVDRALVMMCRVLPVFLSAELSHPSLEYGIHYFHLPDDSFLCSSHVVHPQTGGGTRLHA